VINPTRPREADYQKFGNWRVVRGGSWMLSRVGAPCASSAFWDGAAGASDIGFRVVRETVENASVS